MIIIYDICETVGNLKWYAKIGVNLYFDPNYRHGDPWYWASEAHCPDHRQIATAEQFLLNCRHENPDENWKVGFEYAHIGER